jgi:hypothetical protein
MYNYKFFSYHVYSDCVKSLFLSVQPVANFEVKRGKIRLNCP